MRPSRKLPRPAGDVVEDGVPATEEVRDEVLRTGDTGLADMPVPDRPIGATEWGTTGWEERTGEPLDVRLAREVPDDDDGRAPSEGRRRFSEPGADRGFADDQAASVGELEPAAYDTLSAEEAAMTIRDDGPV